jgi:capsular polysaccharide biosynthesis protein
MSGRLLTVEHAITVKQTAAQMARQSGKDGLASAMQVDLAALDAERKHIQKELAAIAASPELFADRTTRAGLDTTLTVVEERRPERPESNTFVLIIVAVVVGIGALLGSAVFIGAFDSRVHDTDDVSRLGLPVLGHVPGFPGDHVGSLGARGALRARVPSFLRWRSHR